MPTIGPIPTDIVAALVTEQGSRRRAALRLGLPERTLHRRLAGHGSELRKLAKAHGWPPPTAAATAASMARANASARARRDAFEAAEGNREESFAARSE